MVTIVVLAGICLTIGIIANSMDVIRNIVHRLKRNPEYRLIANELPTSKYYGYIERWSNRYGYYIWDSVVYRVGMSPDFIVKADCFEGTIDQYLARIQSKQRNPLAMQYYMQQYEHFKARIERQEQNQ